MDKDEEEGLRVFALAVGCDDVSRRPMRPLWIARDGMRADVRGIISEWIEEERVGFRLEVSGGVSVLLYYVPELELWSGVWPAGATESSIVRRRR